MLIAASRLLAAALLAASVAGCSTSPRAPALALPGPNIARAAAIVRAGAALPQTARFISVAAPEPDKSAPDTHPRAVVVVYDYATHTTTEHLVDLAADTIERSTPRPGVQPQVLEEEFTIASDLTRADPRWREAVAKRGVTDFNAVLIDGWAPGERAPAGVPDGTRAMRMLSYDTSSLPDVINPYSRPIEGVEVIVDLDSRRVVAVSDFGVVPPPRSPRPPAPQSAFDLKPLRSSQPQGPSFALVGDALSWGAWRLRTEFHPRDGLILRDVGWSQGGQTRSILASARLSEMVVPYGDPSASWRWRSAFDSGEYGLGNSSRTLTPGREVPENAVVLPAEVVTSDGSPKIIPGAIAVYERDAGLGYLHYDYLSGTVESARARELWLTSIVTIGNYDYGVNWIFAQDGSIRVEAMLTGILLPKGTAAGECSACDAVASGETGEGRGDQRTGTLVAPGVVAPNHQHWFNFRLDFDVDGRRNSVLEMNTRSAGPGPENPAGNAFLMTETLLRTERDARRDVSLADHRLWRIVNPGVRNSLGHLSGYELVPAGNVVPYAASGSSLLHDAPFVAHHLWVTNYDPAELHAAGDYPNQSKGGEGLARWVSDDPIVNGDVVVWYTFALTHTPRAEEWPMMSTERAGFRLLPRGFFDRNPAYPPR